MKKTAMEERPTRPPALRVERTVEQAKENYDRLSRFYDLIASSEQQYIDRGLRLLNLQPGEMALEIGFGTGRAIITLAKSAGDSGRVYGIDISEGMFRAAQKKIQLAGVSRFVELCRAEATNLPYSARFFDAVFMSFTLELFDTPQIPVVLSECRRVLKPAGRIGVVAMTKGDTPGTAVRLYEWAHKRFPAALDCRPIYAQDELQKAGFRIERSASQSMWGLPLEILLAKPA